MRIITNVYTAPENVGNYVFKPRILNGYLVIGSSNGLYIYRIDGSKVALITSDTSHGVCHDSCIDSSGYIYTAYDVDQTIRAYSFNGTTLTEIDSIATDVYCSSICSDGTYTYAIVGGFLKQYSFDGSTLSVRDSFDTTAPYFHDMMCFSGNVFGVYKGSAGGAKSEIYMYYQVSVGNWIERKYSETYLPDNPTYYKYQPYSICNDGTFVWTNNSDISLYGFDGIYKFSIDNVTHNFSKVSSGITAHQSSDGICYNADRSVLAKFGTNPVEYIYEYDTSYNVEGYGSMHSSYIWGGCYYNGYYYSGNTTASGSIKVWMSNSVGMKNTHENFIPDLK